MHGCELKYHNKDLRIELNYRPLTRSRTDHLVGSTWEKSKENYKSFENVIDVETTNHRWTGQNLKPEFPGLIAY